MAKYPQPLYGGTNHMDMLFVFLFFQTIMDDSFRVELLDERIEEVQTTYECDVFQYTTAYKQNLTRHIKTIDTVSTEPGQPANVQTLRKKF